MWFLFLFNLLSLLIIVIYTLKNIFILLFYTIILFCSTHNSLNRAFSFTVTNFLVVLIHKPLHTSPSDTLLKAELLNQRLYILKAFDANLPNPLILFLLRLCWLYLFCCLCSLFITKNIRSILFLLIYEFFL